MNAAVARGIKHIAVVSEIAGGIVPGSDRVALAVEGCLRAKGGVFVELLSAVVGIEQKREVIVPYIAAGGIDRLEREAGTIAEASAHRPAGLLFERRGAGRRDDLGVDRSACMSEIARRVAGRGDPEGD